MEPIADVVTGGLVGRAAEPDAGEVSPDGHTTETNCLNCGSSLVGDYCHACGQRGHVHRSLHAFGHDLLHGVFHFEGKIWRTLPMLAWRPGELTRRYIEGQRASFVSPIALFLFFVFLMFAVLSLTSTSFTLDGDATRRDIAEAVEKDEARLGRLREERRVAATRGAPVADLDERISDLQTELAVTRGLAGKATAEDAATEISTKIDPALGPLNRAYLKAKKNPELLFYKLKTNAYKFSWMLIPLSVPFVWLLFPFSRRFRMYDHTVFVTYSLCFMTLLAIAASLLMSVGLGSIAWLLWFVPPIHMYRQLRGAYDLSRAGAVWRTALLVMFAMIVTGLFVTVLVTLGIFD